tara:strand:- start:318 stop:911 length:594 start_codon:yes stop_codon:yes gene_type:complete
MFLKKFRGLGIIFITSFYVPYAALAANSLPKPVIGIVDIQKVLRVSKASKNVQMKKEEMRLAFRKQVKEEQNRLREAERELARQQAVLTPQAFTEKRRAFTMEARKVQKKVQSRRRQLDRVFKTTETIILKHLFKVGETIAEERKLNLILRKRFVFLSANSLDVTEEIIARLNKILPTIKINTDSAVSNREIEKRKK